MRDTSKHTDIKKFKTVQEIFDSFDSLLGMCLLFNKDTEYFKFSGFVTAALLDFNGDDDNILAIETSNIGWITFHWTREDLRKAFENCDAFLGKTEDQSFLLKV